MKPPKSSTFFTHPVTLFPRYRSSYFVGKLPSLESSSNVGLIEHITFRFCRLLLKTSTSFNFDPSRIFANFFSHLLPGVSARCSTCTTPRNVTPFTRISIRILSRPTYLNSPSRTAYSSTRGLSLRLETANPPESSPVIH